MLRWALHLAPAEPYRCDSGTVVLSRANWRHPRQAARGRATPRPSRQERRRAARSARALHGGEAALSRGQMRQLPRATTPAQQPWVRPRAALLASRRDVRLRLDVFVGDAIESRNDAKIQAPGRMTDCNCPPA